MDTGLDSLKTTSEKAVHKTGGFLGNKTVDAGAKLYYDNIVKTKPLIIENQNVEEIIIPPEKKRKNI